MPMSRTAWAVIRLLPSSFQNLQAQICFVGPGTCWWWWSYGNRPAQREVGAAGLMSNVVAQGSQAVAFVNGRSA